MITTKLLTSILFCVLIEIHEWRNLEFKIESQRQIFEIAILFTFLTNIFSEFDLFERSDLTSTLRLITQRTTY